MNKLLAIVMLICVFSLVEALHRVRIGNRFRSNLIQLNTNKKIAQFIVQKTNSVIDKWCGRKRITCAFAQNRQVQEMLGNGNNVSLFICIL